MWHRTQGDKPSPDKWLFRENYISFSPSGQLSALRNHPRHSRARSYRALQAPRYPGSGDGRKVTKYWRNILKNHDSIPKNEEVGLEHFKFGRHQPAPPPGADSYQHRHAVASRREVPKDYLLCDCAALIRSGPTSPANLSQTGFMAFRQASFSAVVRVRTVPLSYNRILCMALK